MVWKISLVVLCTLAAVSCQRTFPRTRYSDEDADNFTGDEIPGTAGIDYPVLEFVPETGFTCDDINFPGYYADPLSGCQAFYVCHKSGRGVSNLCPNGTIFNQDTLVCDWWYNFDCTLAVGLYDKNVDIVEAMAEVDSRNEQLVREQQNRPLSTVTASPLRPQKLATILPGRNRAAAVATPLTSRLFGGAGRLPLTTNLGRIPQASNRRSSYVSQLSSIRPVAGRYNNYNNDNRYNRDNRRNSKLNNNNNKNNDNYNNNNNYKNDIDDDVEFNGYDANSNDISRGYLPPSK